MADRENLSQTVRTKTTKKVKCLHFVGACGRIPGEHYKEFDVWGDEMPPEDKVDVLCRTCFKNGELPEQALAAPADDEQIEASSSSSGSSSSSSSDSPRGKRAKSS